jgi:hypothetical protein
MSRLDSFRENSKTAPQGLKPLMERGCFWRGSLAGLGTSKTPAFQFQTFFRKLWSRDPQSVFAA